LYPLKIQCGSELARESGGSACIIAECSAAFASKLAPTEWSADTDFFVNHESKCGSELVRDEARPANAKSAQTVNRNRARSRNGGAPNSRLYSRLNCEGLS
jgi:hypothetical protein